MSAAANNTTESSLTCAQLNWHKAIEITASLQRLVEAAAKVSGADYGNLQIFDEKTSSLHIIAQKGFPEWWISHWHTVTHQRGCCGTAMAHGKRTIILDIRNHPGFANENDFESMSHLGIKAVQSTPIFARDGRPLGMFSTHYRKTPTLDDRTHLMLDLIGWQAADVLERAIIENNLKINRDRYLSLVQATSALVFSSAPDGASIEPQPGWMRFTGQTADEMLGYGWLNALHKEDREPTLLAWKNAVSAGIPFARVYRVKRYDGKVRWINVQIAPIKDDNQTIVEWFGTGFDITEHKEAEAALRVSEDRFRLAVKADRFGTFEYYPETGEVVWDDQMCKLWNMPLGLHTNYRDILEHVLPEDRENIATSMKNAFKPDSDGYYHSEYRIYWDDGSIHWLSAKGYVEFDRTTAPPRATRVYGIQQDITAAKNAEIERQERFAAQKANDAKSRFLASMSHEIRTPLGIILGYADMLYNDAESQIDRRHFAEVILRNGRHLLAIINDILDLSKVESGKVDTEEKELDVRVLIQELHKQFSAQAHKRGICFKLNINGPVPITITTDETKLKQALFNLVGNAIKFTEKGYVDLNISFRGKQPHNSKQSAIVFTIKDTGCGIPASCSKILFQPFSQAEPYVTRKYGGTGLGLHLTKLIANLLGGDVRLIKSKVNQGSVFEMTIDAGTFSAETFGNILERPSIDNDETQLIKHDRSILSGLRVLVVEDFEDNQNLIRLMLENIGAKVELANNGLEGVSAALKGNFSVVLMDIQMPIMSGYEAATLLRDKGYSQPIIALTAHAMKGELERCIAAGCSGYLTKPINQQDLVRVIVDHVPGISCETALPEEIVNAFVNTTPSKCIRFRQVNDEPLYSIIDRDDHLYEAAKTCVSKLPQHIAEIESFINNAAWDELKRKAHQIAGFGTTIGFPVITDIARSLERELDTTPYNLQRIKDLVSEFKRNVHRIVIP